MGERPRAARAAAPALRGAPRRAGRTPTVRPGRARPAVPPVPLPPAEAGPAPREHASLRRPGCASGASTSSTLETDAGTDEPYGARGRRPPPRPVGGQRARRRRRLARPRPRRRPGRRRAPAHLRRRPGVTGLPHHAAPSSHGHLGGGRPRDAALLRLAAAPARRPGRPRAGTRSAAAGPSTTENRRRLPPAPPRAPRREPERHEEVDRRSRGSARRSPTTPAIADAFAWPTSHAEAEAAYADFLGERFHEFGPYEDALIAAERPVALPLRAHARAERRPADPAARVLRAGAGAWARRNDVPLAEPGGLRAAGDRLAGVHAGGLRARTAAPTAHPQPARPRPARSPRAWWTAPPGSTRSTTWSARVLEHGYAHHIERLMVLGNAMLLLRIDPDAAYEWFMEMFVDAYDWVMVPNVYAMSQFAAGDAGDDQALRVRLELPAPDVATSPPGEWRADWDALYWTVRPRPPRRLRRQRPRSRRHRRLRPPRRRHQGGPRRPGGSAWLG